MRIKPILFSTPMVQAILDGRKTMTRRVVKFPRYIRDDGERLILLEDGGGYSDDWTIKSLLANGHMSQPYSPSDILWVRETWCNINKPEFAPEYYYKADAINAEDYDSTEWKWRPSIFMPRESARTWLRVTDVRVERVQDITENDAMAEGCSGVVCEHSNSINGGCSDCMNTGWLEPPELEFMDLWDSLNAKRGYGWDANPWVWVISFKQCEMPPEATP